MDLQPQASFIPKKPLTSSAVSTYGVPSILWVISIFIFIVSIVAAGAVFVYSFYLQHQIDVAQSSLDSARAAYDPTSIEDLVRLNTRIEQAKNLLQNHLAPSALFTFLEQNTLSTVRYTQFEYTANPDGSMNIKLTGNAVDFASVALQSDQFGAAIHMLKNLVFSGINIDPSTGIVTFQVGADVNPDALLYSNNIPSSASSTSVVTTSVPTPNLQSSTQAASTSSAAPSQSTSQPIPPAGAPAPSH